MAEQDPLVPPEEPQEPAYKFGPVADDPSSHMATKADLARIESLIAQGARTKVDPSTITSDGDRELAAILERLEKDPLNGFKDHNAYQVNSIAKAILPQVKELLDQQFGAMREEREIGNQREQL